MQIRLRLLTAGPTLAVSGNSPSKSMPSPRTLRRAVRGVGETLLPCRLDFQQRPLPTPCPCQAPVTSKQRPWASAPPPRAQVLCGLAPLQSAWCAHPSEHPLAADRVACPNCPRHGDALLGHVSSRLVAQIHDELLFEVEDSQIPEFAGESGGNGAAFIS